MKYVITGGAGFIGCNIARSLLAKGETVKVIDNFLTGKRENLADIAADVEVVEIDIRDTDRMAKEFSGFDYVLHQAALPSVPRSIDDPMASHQNNTEGTLSVLIGARDAGIKRVVYAASSSAYGNCPDEIKNESILPGPLSPYASQKLAGEYYCRAFYESFGLETVALRYFNVFGPYQDPKSTYAAVIPKFIIMMMAGQRPIIDGDGMQSRDFTFVQNNVQANILAATKEAVGVAGEVFNIACGDSINLNDLVVLINEMLGTSIEPDYGPPRAGDVKHSLADISKARKALGYEAGIDFKEGLRRTVDWHKERSKT